MVLVILHISCWHLAIRWVAKVRASWHFSNLANSLSGVVELLVILLAGGVSLARLEQMV